MRNDYLNDIRKHLQQVRQIGNINNFIIYDVKNDERYDPSLISQRLYGTRKHEDVVMVACGLNGVWEPLPMRRIILPLIGNITYYRNLWSITD